MTAKMKKLHSIWAMAIVLLVVCGAMTSCKGKKTASSDTAAPTESVTPEKTMTPVDAVDKYLVDVPGKGYSQGDVCIPCARVLSTDESDPADVKVWGDFWVFNYKINGDTLETVSGGSHPGLMHLRKTDSGYEVTSFDAVGDGSTFIPTAKKIFGDRYEDFMKMNSDQEGREAVRKDRIKRYVQENGLSVTQFKDYGWDPVKL